MLPCVAGLLEKARRPAPCLRGGNGVLRPAHPVRRDLPGVELMTGASRSIDSLRLVKDADEIAFMTQAQKLTDDAFAHILNFITPERTELEVALGWNSICARTVPRGRLLRPSRCRVPIPQAARRAGRPQADSQRLLHHGFGARRNGYCADMTRTVVLGKADDEMKRLYGTVLEAQTRAIESLHVGMPCCDADKVARDIIDNAGYKGLLRAQPRAWRRAVYPRVAPPRRLVPARDHASARSCRDRRAGHLYRRQVRLPHRGHDYHPPPTAPFTTSHKVPNS